MSFIDVTGGTVSFQNGMLKNYIINNPSEKKIPFLTLCLTKQCPFKCIYCGEGGEVTISKMPDFTYDYYKEVIDTAKNCGIEKIRFTGGEPFAFKKIHKILEYIKNKDITVLINTNGLLVDKVNESSLENASDIHIAVSLDSLKEDVFDKISNTKGNFKRVIKNIDWLIIQRRLLRINMVITPHNVSEIPQMIDFCLEKNVNLKLQEVCSVPIPYGNWANLHIPLEKCDSYLKESADEILIHNYSRGHGIPIKVYRIGNIMVTNKSLAGGSHYDVDGICQKCPYFPCHEGLYDIFVLPDHSIATCRWHSIMRKNLTDALVEAKEIFMRSQYFERPLKKMNVTSGIFV